MSLSGPKHGPPIGLWLPAGAFLPSVWERVPEPAQFVRQLRRKADLAPDHWSDDLRVSRYTAESSGAPFRAL